MRSCEGKCRDQVDQESEAAKKDEKNEFTPAAAVQKLGGLELRSSIVGKQCSLFEFQGASLLRAAKVATILRKAGALLGTSESSAETFELSSPVDHIDAFISHNWSTPRASKFLTLALHFNLTPALVVSYTTACLAFIFQAKGWLPCLDQLLGGEDWKCGLCCRLSGYASFLITLVAWPDFASRVGLGGQSVFLDKVCIHQTDVELQRKGINALSAFIRYSSEMVVVYSDVYLEKLWTVYEVASFLTLHSADRMHVLQVDTARYFLKWFSLALAHVIILTVIQIPSLAKMLGSDNPTIAGLIRVSSIFILLLVPGARIFRQQYLIRERMLEKVAAFTVADARCSKEEDRAIVTHNIAEFMRCAEVSKDTCDSHALEALEAFDLVARMELVHVVNDAFGRSMFKLRYTLALFSLSTWTGLDEIACQLHSEGLELQPRWLLLTALRLCIYPLLFGPLMLAVIVRAVVCLQKVKCLHRWVKDLIAAGIGFVAAVVLFGIGDFLTSQGMSSDLHAALFVVWAAVLLAVKVCIYWPTRHRTTNKIYMERTSLDLE
ncbi:unnamed protein product [Polarella glacialis]|uniref:Uncharacterized protein n=1 Tax=Polarella glacialis TaxID=89957 RepID=A0A813KIR4_POLGL|nr:unnamed protein product [Polarella glacialis]